MLAYVWHYWIGVGLFLMAVVTCIAIAVGYLVKVEKPKYAPTPPATPPPPPELAARLALEQETSASRS